MFGQNHINANLTIAAGSNNVTLSGTVTVGRNFTYTSGNLITTGSTLVFKPGCGSGGAITITPGSVVYGDVQFLSADCTYTSDGVSGTLNVGGNLTIRTGHNLTLHAFSLNGNTLTKNGGVLTVGTGSSPYGGTVNP